MPLSESLFGINMKKWFLIIALVIIVLVAAFFLLHHKKVTYKTITVKKGSLSSMVIASGQIVPKHAISVKSQISGVINKIDVKEGDQLKVGQTLIDINPNPTPQDYAQLVSNFKQTQAKYNDSKTKYDRSLAISDQKNHFVSQQTLQDEKQAMLADKAEFDYAKQSLELQKQGKTDIAGKAIRSTVVSPIAGRVLKINVDVGDSIVPVTPYQAGTPLITMANMRNLVFKGEVSQTDIGKLKDGMKAALTIAPFPDKTLKGKVSQIALQSLDNTQSQQPITGSQPLFQTPTELQNGFAIEIAGFTIPEGEQIRAGYQATANILVKSAKGVLVVPERVLHFKGDKIYVLLPQQQGEPKKQFVSIGISSGTNVQIKSGLKFGQLVIDPQGSS